MKKLICLLKKDIILSNYYALLSLAMLFVVPCFLAFSGETINLGCTYILFMEVSFACYFLLSNIFATEDKYKGIMYLMSIPYEKILIVVTKYVLVFFVYLLAVVCYFVLSNFSILQRIVAIPNINLTGISITFLIVSIVYSIFFPLYFRYSYEQIKSALMIISILIPCWAIPALSYSDYGIDIISQKASISVGAAILLFAIGTLIASLSILLSKSYLSQRDF